MAASKKTKKKSVLSKSKSSQKWASEELKSLLEHMKSEPFPTQKALERENKKLLQEEKKLARMLSPMKGAKNPRTQYYHKSSKKQPRKKKSKGK